MAILSDSDGDDDDDDDDDDIYGNLNGSKKLKMKNKYTAARMKKTSRLRNRPPTQRERPKSNLSRVYIEMR